MAGTILGGACCVACAQDARPVPPAKVARWKSSKPFRRSCALFAPRCGITAGPRNRRLIALALSARGQRTVAAARQATERRLAEAVASIPLGQRAAIHRALRALRERFQADHPLTPSLAKGRIRPVSP